MTDLARQFAITRSERYQSWKRGWRDGSNATVKRQVFLEHPRLDLRDAYEAGYVAGLNARGAADEQAAKYSGHQPSVLREGLLLVPSAGSDAPSGNEDGGLR